MTYTSTRVLFKRTGTNQKMGHQLKNREAIDRKISKIKEKRRLISKGRKRRKKTRKQLKRCEKFFRGLMRTHLRFPELNEKWVQYFFQDQNGETVLVEEYMAKGTENLMPKMKRIPLSKAQRAHMSTGGYGYIIYICPTNNFDKGHARFVVDFNKDRSEPYEKHNGDFRASRTHSLKR